MTYIAYNFLLNECLVLLIYRSKEQKTFSPSLIEVCFGVWKGKGGEDLGDRNIRKKNIIITKIEFEGFI